MKTSHIVKILIAEAVLCMVLVGFSVINTNVLSSLFAFPFEQIAFGLRWLSLKGGFFNIIALSLYVLISALPIIYFFAKTRKSYKNIDFLLLINSLLIFVGLYLMINPSLIGNFLTPLPVVDPSYINFYKGILGGVIYSGFSTYIVLNLIDKTEKIYNPKLQNYVLSTLILLCVILVFEVFALNLQNTLKSVHSISAMTINPDKFLLSYVFTVINYIVASAPMILSVNIILKIIKVMSCYFDQSHESNVLVSAIDLGEASKKSLQITVITSLCFNIMQIMFSPYLVNSNYTLAIPVLAIALLFASLIFAKMVEDNYTLKKDNESII